jgi:hypothetical protein
VNYCCRDEKTGITVELPAFIVTEMSKPLTEMVYGLNEVNRTVMLKGVFQELADRLYGTACIY